MKPLNLDNSPCSPISSNCVIWQGPDIPCIKLCRGDSISDVIHKLATELCNIMDLLDVNGYDLSCFDLVACKPTNIQELIQFLIERICAIEDVDAGLVAENALEQKSASADTLVTVAPCFVIGTTTVMTVTEYAVAMGIAICGLIDQITLINLQLDTLNIRVTTLETAIPPSFTVPSIIVDCTLSSSVTAGNSYTIDIVLNALVNDNTYGYCVLLSSTGLPADIVSAVLSQCIANTSVTLTNPPVPFATEYLGSWINTPVTVADAITNLWITVCDIYNYLIALTFTGDTTSTIELKNQEQNVFSGTGAYNTSHLNYVVSHVIGGDNVPEFDSINTNINSNTGAGTTSLDLEYSATNLYPFSCNANSEQELGGFIFILDGLLAYIDPCTTDIPIPIVCP